MKKSFLGRTFAFLLACIMCMSLGVTAFAAENTTPATTEIENSATESVARTRVPSQQEVGYLSLSEESFSMTVNSMMLNVDFSVSVYGKENVTYDVWMSHGGNNYYMGTVNGNGDRTGYLNLSIATAGLYTFTVEANTNTSHDYIVVANLYND